MDAVQHKKPGKVKPLKACDLYRKCDPETLPFETTAELDGNMVPAHQPRAVASLKFGMTIEQEGYNIFARRQPYPA
jgi:hypothetical protein